MSYDSNTNRLYFNDGSFWAMGCRSAGTEEDAGTLYPTLIRDSNGNQITLVYSQGLGVTWQNSSGRLVTIQDTRATLTNPTHQFSYNTDPIPHLTSITNTIGTAESYTFGCVGNTLYSPFNGASCGYTSVLNGVTVGRRD